jgi:hypothetical protein
MSEHCTVCGRVCWDSYMIDGDVLKTAGLRYSDVCHFDCLSKRLGRELNIKDFKPSAPINRTLIFGYHMGRRSNEKEVVPTLPPTGD